MRQGGYAVALNARQQAFVREYLIDLNATQAAIRAGYSAATAGVIGHQNLSKLQIAEAIAQAQAERARRTEVTQDWVVKRLAEEADDRGRGASHAARVSALKLLGEHVGMWAVKPPLEQFLDSLPAATRERILGELAADLRGRGTGGPGAAPPA